MSLAIPSNFANAVAPFVPAGRLPVSEENEELRESSLKPLEQLPESARRENRRSADERANNDGERQRLIQGADEGRAGSAEGPEDAAGRALAEGAEQSARERELERQREQQEQAEIRELAARDREVRMHEQAHAALGGRHAGAPRYEYQRGPDGVSYAVSGEVPIDTSKVPNDPRATIEKAQQIRRAAFAPQEPSDTDRRVAAEAARMENEARAELRREQAEQVRGGDEADNPRDDVGDSVLTDAEVGDEDEQSERDSLGLQQTEQQRRNLDTYRQLIELGTLGELMAPGALFDQRT